MAITKNKILLRDKSFSLENEMINFFGSGWYGSWGDYDDDFRPYKCDCSECNDYWGGQCEYEGNWEYLNDISDDFNNHIITTRYSKKLSPSPIIGRMIDMRSIYSKEVLREKKINQILGLENYTYYKPSMKEIFPKNIITNED